MKGCCFCGAVQIEWSDNQETLGPITLCHCLNCRKLTGTFSTNFVLPTSSLTITGTTKIFQNRKGSSGSPAERHFCGECASVLFTRGAAFPGFTVLKANVLNIPDGLEGTDVREWEEKWRPRSEAFCRSRLEWLPEFEGTECWETLPVGPGAKRWDKKGSVREAAASKPQA